LTPRAYGCTQMKTKTNGGKTGRKRGSAGPELSGLWVEAEVG
jgi:hypothetical protein